jgi:F-type H+-transporting ATPase subunit a
MKKPLLRAKKAFSVLFFVVFIGLNGLARPTSEANETEAKPFDANAVILEHVMDDHQWHFTDHIVLPLPIIVYTTERGLDIFSSSNFYGEHHQAVEFNGYKLEHNHILLANSGNGVLDFSITKNVAMLFVNAAVLLVVFLSVSKAYRKNVGKAPSGIQSFMEPLVVFVRDEIVKPNIGHYYEKYLPYLLTLFFFILFGNLLGLVPGAANLTGNIAVTLILAVLTFFITNLSGNKNYWKHIFWTPGIPLVLRPLILPVEIIGVFTKPFSLTIRLFVAITAGHIVLLSLICLAFIFSSWYVGIGTSIVVVFINLIELLVAGIQAYVFTLFTSLYIGMATAEDHH